MFSTAFDAFSALPKNVSNDFVYFSMSALYLIPAVANPAIGKVSLVVNLFPKLSILEPTSCKSFPHSCITFPALFQFEASFFKSDNLF